MTSRFPLCVYNARGCQAKHRGPRKSHRFESFESDLISVCERRLVEQIPGDRSTPDAIVIPYVSDSDKHLMQRSQHSYTEEKKHTKTLSPHCSPASRKPSMCQNTQHIFFKTLRANPQSMVKQTRRTAERKKTDGEEKAGHVRIIRASLHIIRQYVVIN